MASMPNVKMSIQAVLLCSVFVTIRQVDSQSLPCDTNPCENDGMCFKLIFPQCFCRAGTTGRYCGDTVVNNGTPNTCSGYFGTGWIACHDSNDCFRETWKCDTDFDCKGGSGQDEFGCEEPFKDCRYDYLTRCPGSGNAGCIPTDWLCDQQDDCRDGSDESPETCGSAVIGIIIGITTLIGIILLIVFIVCAFKFVRCRTYVTTATPPQVQESDMSSNRVSSTDHLFRVTDTSPTNVNTNIAMHGRRHAPLTLNTISAISDTTNFSTPVQGNQLLQTPRNITPSASTPTSSYLIPDGIDAIGITRDQLKLIKELGSGQFGCVWLAERIVAGKDGGKVAVKSIKDGAPSAERVNLLSEIKVMKKFKSHPNVIQMLGSCTEKDPFYIILEYMANGSLKEVLMESRQLYDYVNTNQRDVKTTLSENQLMMFAKQVADGMDFITSNKCVHRDLAARNVLVGDDFVCKVSDFGLARVIANYETYTLKSDIPLPIRWMAIESLQDGIHTKESDVWSFGILLWEIVTLGARPYPGMGTKAVRKELLAGHRLSQPKHCLKEIYDIMRSCWASNPSSRPTFAQLSRQLQKIQESKADYIILDEIERGMYYNDTAVVEDDEKV